MDYPQVVPATEEHARVMAPNLREADKAEIAAMTGSYPLTALLRGLQGDVCIVALTPEGDPFLMAGVAPSRFPEAGYVWMLGTDVIATRFSLPFLRHGREYFDAFHDVYPLLHNYVDARNEVHIRWLKWLGCTFIQTRRMGVQGRPFHEFVRIRKSHV